MKAERLSIGQARRIALAAQGFTDRRLAPGARTDVRHGRRVFDRVGLVQLDSVNVVVRSHELPFFARLGPHDRTLVAKLVARRELFEYWGHEASLLPVDLQPLLRWRMADAAAGRAWPGLVEIARTDAGYVEAILAEVAERGPISAGELTEPGARGGPWWGWNQGKRALEYLFWCGRVTAERRWPGFERVYDLPERVLPAEVLRTPTPSRADAQRELLALAARCLGIATERDLGDYFRLSRADVGPRLAELVEDGRLLPADVAGWAPPAYLDPDAARPRRVNTASLISPFDSLMWFRERTERLFDFHYRLEFYVPSPQRHYGYYVVPFLLGERLVARVDLKADRKARVLLVLAAYGEAHAVPHEVVGPLRRELDLLAGWLGLDGVEVATRGDLGPALVAATGD